MFKFIFPTFNFNIERWKWNKEYRVYVSNMGHFRNEHKQFLKIMIDSKGYLRVKTQVGLKSAHRLVLLTWRPIPDAENLTVDHLDHNKRNNAVSNLEWVSHAENQRRAIEDLVAVNEVTNKIKTWQIRFKCSGQVKYFINEEEAANYIMQLKSWKKDQNIIDPKYRTKEYVVQKITAKADAGGKYYGTWSRVFRQKRRYIKCHIHARISE